jgi:hypothetical protein
MVNRYGYIKVDYTSDRGIYRCHLFPLKYDEMLIKYYNNNQLFLQKKLDKKVIKNTKIFEKTEIRWFTVNELTKMKKEFRSFYQNIIDLLLDKNQLKEITILAKKIKNVHTKTKKK